MSVSSGKSFRLIVDLIDERVSLPEALGEVVAKIGTAGTCEI